MANKRGVKPRHDYTELDAAIVAALKDGPAKFAQIFDRPTVASSLAPIAELEPSTEPWRVVDRRLQALRRFGTVKHTPKGWVAVSQGEAGVAP
jgi:hypothetical protein